MQRFAELLRQTGLTPRRYAEIKRFDRRNVVRWIHSDEAIPAAIRSRIIGDLIEALEQRERTGRLRLSEDTGRYCPRSGRFVGMRSKEYLSFSRVRLKR